MNNKGFIATSLIYAFFLVFVAVVATVLATYAHNRILVDNVNSGVVDDLNKSIENKYVLLQNLVVNGDFEEDGGWTLENAANLNPSFSTFSGVRSIAIYKGNSSIRQNISNLQRNHYYYFRYYVFRNGTITGTSNVTLSSGGTSYNFNLGYYSPDLVANWNLLSSIVEVSTPGTYTLNISGTGIGGNYSNLNIDSLIFTDITDFITEGTNVVNLKTYLDSVDYFTDTKSVAKP